VEGIVSETNTSVDEQRWLEALDKAEDWDLDGAETGPDYDPEEDPYEDS